MASIEFVTLEVPDPAAAEPVLAALGLDTRVRLRSSDAPATGFRGFTLSLVVSRPATVDGFVDAALAAGASTLKPPAKSLWGYGGVVRSPDGTIVTLASSSKKDTGSATREVDDVVLQLGVVDVAASRQFYAGRGLAVAKSYGRRYVQFDSGPVTLALYKRAALAKLAGVPADGTGSHRLVVGSEVGPFTDPDGFEWELASASSTT